MPGDGMDSDGTDSDEMDTNESAENETAQPTDGQSGERTLTTSDIVALALGLGVAGALLVPLFYAAHTRAERQ